MWLQVLAQDRNQDGQQDKTGKSVMQPILRITSCVGIITVILNFSFFQSPRLTSNPYFKVTGL